MMREHRRIYIVALVICMMFAVSVFSALAQPPSEQPAGSAQVEKFTFTVFGDNRPNRSGLGQSGIFKTILKSMNELDPVFAVSTGDAIYGASSREQLLRQYKDYTDAIQALFTPRIYLALGNHEILGSKSHQEFFTKELGGSPYYSFDYGNSHFIVLDSEYVGQAGKITGQQLEWLKSDLEKSRNAQFKFVFLHRPLYPVDGHMGSSMDQYPKDRDALHMLFTKNRITAVFVGYEHLFNEQYRNGVRYLITGGGGAFLYPSVDGTGDFYHYIAVTVDGDKLEMKLIRPAMNGKPREESVIGIVK